MTYVSRGERVEVNRFSFFSQMCVSPGLGSLGSLYSMANALEEKRRNSMLRFKTAIT